MGGILQTFGLVALIGTLSFSSSHAAETRLEGIGEIGGGIFLPTGSDGDVAQLSPALQLTASVRFAPHLGAEVEFLYVPILLKSRALPDAAYRKSSQMSALAGLRIVSGQILNTARPAVGYISLRAGCARLVTRTNTALPEGSWIGRSVDVLENPENALGFSQRSTQKGFALSPRAGVLLRLTDRMALDLAFHPIFIFDREDVNTQLFFTLSFALSAWQNF